MRVIFAAVAAVFLGHSVWADSVQVEGAYARVAMENAPAGAVFMELVNHGDADDRLIAVQSDIAERAELHTHVMSAEGLMQMLPVEEGFVVPAHGSHALARGRDHVMLMGLTGPLAEGDKFTLTLTFEQAGKVVVVVPVRNEDPAGAATDHSGHSTAPASE